MATTPGAFTLTRACTGAPAELAPAHVRVWSTWARLTFMICASLIAARPAWAQHAGQYSAADIQYGASLYAAQCSQCHGPNGDLVSAVNLRSGKLRRAETDFELRALLTAGIPGTGMPAFRFDDAEFAGITAYVRNMDAVDKVGVTIGDRERGKAVFEGKGGCLTCHRVNGRGGWAGPSLHQIGAQRPAGALQLALIDPQGAMLPFNRTLRVTSRDGRTVSGRRLNEDTYTVALIDGNGTLQAFPKSEIKELTVVSAAFMPSFKDTLSSGELADVLAYLLSLKGQR